MKNSIDTYTDSNFNLNNPANQIETEPEYTNEEMLEAQVNYLKGRYDTSQDRVMAWKGRFEVQSKAIAELLRHLNDLDGDTVARCYVINKLLKLA